MHDKTIDSIRDEQTMRDSNTGQTYKVEAGADQDWKNDQDWTEMEEQR